MRVETIKRQTRVAYCWLVLGQSSSIFPYLRSYAPGTPPTLLRGKLGALAPGPAALLLRKRPISNGINGLYGHGFYGNGNGYGVLEIRH